MMRFASFFTFSFITSFAVVTSWSWNAHSTELLTNSARFTNPPKWLTLSRVNKAAQPIESFMEWSTRRVEVTWYSDQAAFEKAHKLGPAAVAVAIKGQNKILLGPKVTEKNFNQVFGHELVHIISAQKYKDAIPPWLEEGAANFISKNGRVDYLQLSQYEMSDYRELAHPMRGSAENASSRYQASQALAEMIASKCDFRNLLRLSVQRKLEDYLNNICRISDVNASYKKWVMEKARR